MATDFEFYETPAAVVRWLFMEMAHRGSPIVGRIFEPCVGSGAIPTAACLRPMEFGVENRWLTNDLDPRWPADTHLDAQREEAWALDPYPDWSVSNTPFTPAIKIITNALKYSRVGVAMHLRASIHEVLKTGERRSWMAGHPPTGILWLPRFAYQRNKKGKWATDSVTCAWCIWLKPTRAVEAGYGSPVHGVAFEMPAPQFVAYAPPSVLNELDAETPAYRARMDRLMADRRVA